MKEIKKVQPPCEPWPTSYNHENNRKTLGHFGNKQAHCTVILAMLLGTLW